MSSTCDLQLDLIKKFLRRSHSSITPRAVPNGIDPRLGFPFMVFGAAILHPLFAKDALQMLLSVEKDRCKSPTNLVGAPPMTLAPRKRLALVVQSFYQSDFVEAQVVEYARHQMQRAATCRLQVGDITATLLEFSLSLVK